MYPRKKQKVETPTYPENHFMDYLVEQGAMEYVGGQLTMKNCMYTIEDLTKQYKKKYL